MALTMAVVVAAVVGAFSIPTAANAATRVDVPECEYDICIFADINFKGVGKALDNGYYGANLGIVSFNNVTSSVINTSGSRWCLYDDINYGGNWIVMLPHTYTADLRGFGFNDKASSIQVCG